MTFIFCSLTNVNAYMNKNRLIQYQPVQKNFIGTLCPGFIAFVVINTSVKTAGSFHISPRFGAAYF